MKIPKPNLRSHVVEHPELAPSLQVPDGDYITCFDPATGFHLGTMLTDTAHEIQEKISIASLAQGEWRKTSFRERRRVIRSLKKWLVENQEACAKVACRDTGKTCKSIG